MKLKIGCEYELTTQKTIPNKRYNINVIESSGDFFKIQFFDEFGGFVSTNYYTQKMINDLVTKGSWVVVRKESGIVLDEDLFIM